MKAGVQDAWIVGEDGTERPTATIITAEAGPVIAIQDRLWVVLEGNAWEQWPDPQLTDRNGLESPPPRPTARGPWFVGSQSCRRSE